MRQILAKHVHLKMSNSTGNRIFQPLWVCDKTEKTKRPEESRNLSRDLLDATGIEKIEAWSFI
jgi:hypothetical protein